MMAGVFAAGDSLKYGRKRLYSIRKYLPLDFRSISRIITFGKACKVGAFSAITSVRDLPDEKQN